MQMFCFHGIVLFFSLVGSVVVISNSKELISCILDIGIGWGYIGIGWGLGEGLDIGNG